MSEKESEPQWTWDIDLEALIGAFIRIETNESMYRDGRLSAVRYREIPFLGETIRVPIGLEMNGDATDVLPFELIKKVEAAV